MSTVNDWLLSGPAWLRYRTLIDLQDMPVDSGAVVTARLSLLKDPQIASIIAELADWPGPALKRHPDASHLLHKLVFLADLGLYKDDRQINPIVQQVFENRSEQGAFQILVNKTPSEGANGQDVRGWSLYNTPSVLYSLARLGLRQDNRVQQAAKHLANLGEGNGWPNVVSPDMGKFKGPGRKSHHWPYATLITLKALAQLPDWKDHQVCKAGAERLLNLWEQRQMPNKKSLDMGRDFARLKAPFVWFDILHVTEVLTQFTWLIKDKRLLDMLSVIEAKADNLGRFTAESTWKSWSAWDFGQKKTPSYWITFLAQRILKRAGRSS